MNVSNYFSNCFVAHPCDDPLVIDPEDNDFKSPLDSSLSGINYVDSHMRIVDVLSQVLHCDSELERRKYFDLLVDTSTTSGSQFAQLDDDTKIQLLKPRSAQSPAELASYVEFVNNFIQANNISEPAPEPTPEPTPEPAPEPASVPAS